MSAVDEHAKDCQFVPKPLEDYSAEEKAQVFDRLYVSALEDFRSAQKFGRAHRGTKQRTWESVMELLGDGVWEAYKRLVR